MVEAFTTAIESLEKTDPDRVRIWPLAGSWAHPASRTVKTVGLLY